MRQGQDGDVVLGEDLRLGGLDDAVRQGSPSRLPADEAAVSAPTSTSG